MSRLAVLSDIHGDHYALTHALAQILPAAPDAILLLGDLLNHGPRNPVPAGYAPADVAVTLNQHARRLIAVRGNCDSEVDQMLLQFPCLAPYNTLLLGARKLCMTHGHLYTLEQLALGSGDVCLSGHTHLPGITRSAEGVWQINPGSVTFPRGGFAPSYGWLDEQGCRLVDMRNGEVFSQCDWQAD